MAETWKEEWPKKSQQGERQEPWQEKCGRVKTRTWVGKLMQTLAGMMVTSPTGMPGAAGAAAFVETVLHYDAGMNSCFVQHLLQLFQRCAFKHDKEEFYILLHSECHCKSVDRVMEEAQSFFELWEHIQFFVSAKCIQAMGFSWHSTEELADWLTDATKIWVMGQCFCSDVFQFCCKTLLSIYTRDITLL